MESQKICFLDFMIFRRVLYLNEFESKKLNFLDKTRRVGAEKRT
ncbi:hypothetical protein [Helicobacter winghamensis]